MIDGDDEDGIRFTSDRNPAGVFNRNVVTPIEVTVTGSGLLQGWIDYDADGDWSPDEAVRFYDVGADPSTATGRTQVPLAGEGTRTFTFDTFFPQATPDPISTTPTVARFRISKTRQPVADRSVAQRRGGGLQGSVGRGEPSGATARPACAILFGERR